MQPLGAKVILADSEAEDYPAANVSDGDPDRFGTRRGRADNPPASRTTWSFDSPNGFAERGQVPAAARHGQRPDQRLRALRQQRRQGLGPPVKKGRFAQSDAMQIVAFDHPVIGRYLKFVALSLL